LNSEENLITVGELLVRTHENGFQDVLSMELWLAFLLGQERKFIFLNPNFAVNKKVEQAYWEGIGEMTEGKPLAQLTGEKEFYGYSFIVNEHVLIPRPESELLVDLAAEYLRSVSTDLMADELTVLDVGTGSGAILLALLKKLPQIKGIGVDISPQALNVAAENARRLNVVERVQFLEGDLLEPVKTPCQVLLANLPYIGTEKFNFVAANVVRYEPPVALYGGTDGLEHYRRLFGQIAACGWFPGLLAGEFGFGQHELMAKLLADSFPGRQARIIPDLAGIPRVFVITS
jgi:release factor glutamine methyltransferase